MIVVPDASKQGAQTGSVPAATERRKPQADASAIEHERSIFHEPWWLDIASSGHWALATVEESGMIVGEMPFYFTRRGPWKICLNPPLTRTLGPLILSTGQSPRTEFQHRVSVTTKLIERIPPVDRFFQVFDPRIKDGIAFSLSGYAVSLGFTFRISHEQTREDAWRRIRKYTRNLIEKAERELTIKTVRPVEDFVVFYNANLAERRQKNAYGNEVMRNLLEASVDRKVGTILGA